VHKYFLLLLFPCLLQAQQNSKSLSDRFEGKDSSTVFLAVLRSNSLRSVFPEKVFNKYYNKEEHSFKLSYSALYKEIEKYYNHSNQKQFVLNKMDIWLKNDSLLSVIQKKKDVPIEEVLYKNYNTKSLFKKYLRQKDQTWESLTSWQSYELYIDFLNYAESLSELRSKKVFSSLIKTVDSL
jgi:hypothetical protein